MSSPPVPADVTAAAAPVPAKRTRPTDAWTTIFLILVAALGAWSLVLIVLTVLAIAPLEQGELHGNGAMARQLCRDRFHHRGGHVRRRILRRQPLTNPGLWSARAGDRLGTARAGDRLQLFVKVTRNSSVPSSAIEMMNPPMFGATMS